MALKTDYKDDVLEGRRKYRMITNNDNTVSFEDVTAYTQEGDSFGANDINDTNGGINDALDRLDLNNTRNLVVPADINYTQNGVTMRTNADGSITLSGARSGGVVILYANIFDANSGGTNDANKQKWLPNGKYRIWGDPVGGRIAGKARFQIMGYSENEQIVVQTTSDTATYYDFEITEQVKYISIRMYILANANFGTGMTIYPMITTQSTTDVTGYEQGALSNRALTLKMQALDQDTLFQRAVKNGYKASITNIGDTNPYSILNQPYLYSQAETTGLPSGATSGVTTCFALGDGSIQIVLHDFSNKEFRKTYVKGSAWTSWVEVQLASDSSLQTTNKTIVGAINELKGRDDGQDTKLNALGTYTALGSGNSSMFGRSDSIELPSTWRNHKALQFVLLDDSRTRIVDCKILNMNWLKAYSLKTDTYARHIVSLWNGIDGNHGYHVDVELNGLINGNTITTTSNYAVVGDTAGIGYVVGLD